jgi:ribulose-5-phosphate 4-epimerase/fuculose-1-phosphate aldolase
MWAGLDSIFWRKRRQRESNVHPMQEMVTRGCQVLGAAGQSDLVWGHLSARDPDGRGVWMKASTFAFEEITPDRVLLVDRDGQVVEGTGRRHAEYPIHTEIMAARSDVAAVVHTHSPSAVALGATGHPLQPLSHEATLFVPPDIARFTQTGDLILTADLGRALAATLGDRNAALMINHGLVVAAADVRTAVVTTVLLDAACRMQLQVLAAGGAVHWSSDAEALAKREHCYPDRLVTHAWEYLLRRVELTGTR